MKLLALIGKELRLLVRDRVGMVLLFVMPAFLVVTITLIQERVTNTQVDVILVDGDDGQVSKAIREFFQKGQTIRLVETLGGREISEQQAHDLVAAGKYQFAMVLPENLSKSVVARLKSDVELKLLGHKPEEDQLVIPEVKIWFDPTVHGSFRAAVRTALNQVLILTQARLLIEDTFGLLPEKISQRVAEKMGMQVEIPELDISPETLLPQLFSDTSLIETSEHFTSAMGFLQQPTAVQQNVPAWTIFGIFFICVPLAGSLIRERQTGTMRRLQAMPVSGYVILSAKLIAFGMVCVVQFLFILGAGKYILPLFGLPAFEAGSHPLLLGLVVFSIICGASGYGILLGALGKTYEQVAVFAPVSVVIAAALGGIMVPVYAMPEFIRPLAIISPLYWGQSGFYDVLLRDGGLNAILPKTCALLIFALVNVMVARFFSRRNLG